MRLSPQKDLQWIPILYTVSPSRKSDASEKQEMKMTKYIFFDEKNKTTPKKFM